MDHVTRATPFQEWSVVQRLRLNIAYKHTKFDDVFSSVLEIFQGF